MCGELCDGFSLISYRDQIKQIQPRPLLWRISYQLFISSVGQVNIFLYKYRWKYPPPLLRWLWISCKTPRQEAAVSAGWVPRECSERYSSNFLWRWRIQKTSWNWSSPHLTNISLHFLLLKIIFLVANSNSCKSCNLSLSNNVTMYFVIDETTHLILLYTFDGSFLSKFFVHIEQFYWRISIWIIFAIPISESPVDCEGVGGRGLTWEKHIDKCPDSCLAPTHGHTPVNKTCPLHLIPFSS